MPEYPEQFKVGGQFNYVVGPDLAVASNVVAPTHMIHHIAAAGGLIKTITPPWVGFGGMVVLIAGTTAYTWDATVTTTGGIALAGTSSAAKRAIIFFFNNSTGLWYPTVVA